jgi:hypothetical protein
LGVLVLRLLQMLQMWVRVVLLRVWVREWLRPLLQVHVLSRGQI